MDYRDEPGSTRRPLWLLLLLMLLWLTGLGVLLLFGFFAVITLPSSFWPHSVWNLLVTLVEAWVLFISIRYSVKETRIRSEALLWAVVAAVGVPLVASGGCALMADSFRIAG